MTDLPGDQEKPIDPMFQAGLIALIFRAKKVGMSREFWLECAAHAWDTAEKHAPTLRHWLDLGAELVSSVKSEAKRQRGDG